MSRPNPQYQPKVLRRKSKSRTKEREIRAVVWQDAVTHDGGGWISGEKACQSLPTAVSIGIVLEDTKERVTLAGSFFDEELDNMQKCTVGGTISIPRGWIIKQISMGSYTASERKAKSD